MKLKKLLRQFLTLLFILLIFGFFTMNAQENMDTRGIEFGFRFLKQELQDIDLYPEVGDLLLFKNNFYEVDSRIENQFIFGKDPDYAMATETVNFGKSFSINVSAHLSRVEKLNLIPLREGKYPSLEKLNGGIANRVLDTGIGSMQVGSSFIII